MVAPQNASQRVQRSCSLPFAAVGTLLVVTLLVPPASGGEPVDFRLEVAPIFERHCLRCHQPGNAKGKISLTKFDDLKAREHVVPGQPDESDLLDLVTATSPDERPEMPRKGEPLTPGQVGVLRRWIAEGATWPEGLELQEKARFDTSWWSLQPLATGAPPAFAAGELTEDWLRNPIDRFVIAKLIEKGLRPSEPADRRTLIRRVTYDLTGLPPTPEEVDAFVLDTSPEAYEAVVDRLVASPRYAVVSRKNYTPPEFP